VASRVKWIALAITAIALALGLARAFAPTPVAVEVALVSRAPLQVTVDDDGRTRVPDRFVVSAPLAGTLARIELEPGDTLRGGDPVARIVPLPSPLLDPRSRAEAEARVAAAAAAVRQAATAIGRARAAVEQATRDAARERALVGAGATAPRSVEEAELAERMRREELASAEFGQKVAASELQLARAAVRRLDTSTAASGEELVVRAPVEGQVLRVLQESEGVVHAGDPLVEIGDPSGIEAVVDVLTADAVQIVPGARVLIEQWGGDSALQGHVHRVEPSAFTRVSALGVEEQRVNVIVHLEGAPLGRHALGDGFRVETRIVVWEAGDVLQVPAGAVFRQGDGWAVYLAQNGRAVLRTVRLGRRSDAAAQVLGGLEVGDAVILYPGDNVRDGQRIDAEAP
jgi:HlyD family secretion protein